MSKQLLFKRLVSTVAFPFSILTAILMPLVVSKLQLPYEIGIFGIFLFMIVFANSLQRWLPRETQTKTEFKRDRRVDLTSLAVLMMAVDPALKTAWPILAAILLSIVGYTGGVGLFSLEIPCILKILLALMIAEFGQYWTHRLAHQWLPMWRFHFLHHSAKRISLLVGFRAHPLNIAWHQAAGFLILLLLGVDMQTMSGFLAVSMVVAIMQHANVRLALGWLNYIFSTDELHRWHHSTKLDEANSNYGAVLVLWDQLFGTFRYQPGLAVEKIGLSGRTLYASDSYISQLAGPFGIRMKSRGKADTSVEI